MVPARSPGVRYAAVVGTILLSILIGLALASMPFAIGQFMELLRGFGSDLPFITRKLMSLSLVERLVLFWPGAAGQLLFCGLYLLSRGSAVRTLFQMMTAFNAVVLCGVIYALYAPIFRIGQAI